MHYVDKLSGIPDTVLAAADYQALSEKFMSADVRAYIEGGAGAERTLAENHQAFSRWQILPRVLRDFSKAGVSCELLGNVMRQPFLLGPVAHHGLVHASAELATIEGANAVDCAMIASTLSTCSMEAIAKAAEQPAWFQLYWQPEKKQVKALLHRAEEAGFEAIVLTVDVPVTALRYREQRAGFVHPADVPIANVMAFEKPHAKALQPGESVIFQGVMAEAPGWDDIAWLREQTRLPILLKGVLSPEDALLAQQHDLQGVVVSNHGGRSLDGVPASLAMLPAIRERVPQDFTVLLDSGIRSGSDIFKALALGANAVLIGRLQLHALSVAGALGVAHMLSLLKQELEVVMALAGCRSVNEIRSGSPLLRT